MQYIPVWVIISGSRLPHRNVFTQTWSVWGLYHRWPSPLVPYWAGGRCCHSEGRYISQQTRHSWEVQCLPSLPSALLNAISSPLLSMISEHKETHGPVYNISLQYLNPSRPQTNIWILDLCVSVCALAEINQSLDDIIKDDINSLVTILGTPFRCKAVHCSAAVNSTFTKVLICHVRMVPHLCCYWWRTALNDWHHQHLWWAWYLSIKQLSSKIKKKQCQRDVKQFSLSHIPSPPPSLSSDLSHKVAYYLSAAHFLVPTLRRRGWSSSDGLGSVRALILMICLLRKSEWRAELGKDKQA